MRYINRLFYLLTYYNITEMVGDAVIDVYKDHLVTVMPVDGFAELLF